MKIVFLAHMWCPVHNAGGETTAHSAMRAMIARGHEVTVICRPQSEGEGAKFTDYEFEGVKVIKAPIATAQTFVKELIPELDPDLLITHLDLTTLAMQTAIDLKKPLAHWVHNTMSFEVFRVIPTKCQLAIFNSQWVADYHKWENPQIIIHPTVEPERYRCKSGNKITLVNPTPGKGADTFYALAKALPKREFLCVKSVYGEQIAAPNINPMLHPNVETMEHTADIREVFAKTKILLMPSDYESYGRVAVEAACAGIPSIVHPTAGLLEALGADGEPTREDLKDGWISGAGIFCHRIKSIESKAGSMTRQIIQAENVENLASWVHQIERLMTDDVYYRSRSDAVLKLANNLNPEQEFDRLEEALLVTSRDWASAQEQLSTKMWVADRRIYKRPDGSLSDSKEGALCLFCAEGHQMPLNLAVQYGFASQPAVVVSREMSTDELTEGKMVEGPAENKAMAQPKSKKRKAA